MKEKTYILLYVKKKLILASLIPVTILIAFSLLSLFDPSVRGRVWAVSCISAIICLVPVLLGLLCIIRFRRMIQLQESALNVVFQDSNADSFSKDPLVYLADDWLICAGSMAFHRDYICSITWEQEFSMRAGSGYHLKIRTMDHKKYRVYLHSVQTCRKIHSWWHRKGECDTLEVISELWDIGVF